MLKSAFFMITMVALATACSSNKPESTGTAVTDTTMTTMSTDSATSTTATTMSTDSMSTDTTKRDSIK
ncbi:hypothetical protein [uncultured Spirosoma sp.]|uniref:hypothetical protein n=1 Tax=uncultured Spirosoma sp. TaxID=278208 RepID=UPI002586995A|nr:hypothetical protein [uncultured Spirosoma sp.]